MPGICSRGDESAREAYRAPTFTSTASKSTRPHSINSHQSALSWDHPPQISSVLCRLGYLATCSTPQRHGARDQARTRQDTMEHAVRRRSPRRKQDRIILHFVRIHPHTISPEDVALTPVRITTASTHKSLRMPSLR